MIIERIAARVYLLAGCLSHIFQIDAEAYHLPIEWRCYPSAHFIGLTGPETHSWISDVEWHGERAVDGAEPDVLDVNPVLPRVDLVEMIIALRVSGRISF